MLTAENDRYNGQASSGHFHWWLSHLPIVESDPRVSIEKKKYIEYWNNAAYPLKPTKTSIYILLLTYLMQKKRRSCIIAKKKVTSRSVQREDRIDPHRLSSTL